MIRWWSGSEFTLPQQSLLPAPCLPSWLLSRLAIPWGFSGDSQPPAEDQEAERWWREVQDRPHWPINSSLACSSWAQASLVPTLSLFPLFQAVRGGSYPGSCILAMQEEEINEKWRREGERVKKKKE